MYQPIQFMKRPGEPGSRFGIKIAASILLLILCSLLVAVTAQAQATPQYTVTDLGTFGGTASTAWGINNLAELAGESLFPGNGYRHAFMYSGGKMIDL